MIKEYPKNNNYMISDDGKVFSKNMNRYLTPKHNHDGYLRIQIWRNCKVRFVSIHRLVAETFIPNPDNLPFVNHIDGDKTNNHVTNLEWCTQKENIKHAWKTGLSNNINHSKHGRITQYDCNGTKINEFVNPSEASKQTGISYFTILASAKKLTKARKRGYYWRFS